MELELLGSALSHIQTIKPVQGDLVHLEAIRAAVSACQIPLNKFLEKISKYDSSLGCWDAKNKRFGSIKRRIEYIVLLEGEVKELRASLAGHTDSIKLLLQTQSQ